MLAHYACLICFCEKLSLALTKPDSMNYIVIKSERVWTKLVSLSLTSSEICHSSKYKDSVFVLFIFHPSISLIKAMQKYFFCKYYRYDNYLLRLNEDGVGFLNDGFCRKKKESRGGIKVKF